MNYPAAILCSLPWIVPPIVTWVRVRNSRSLDSESDSIPRDAPLVSVIVPARNEASNIERCVASILLSSYAPLEVLVVDDDSSDDTGAIARAIAERDSRLRVIDNTPPPPDWFGKQWACATGANRARGEILHFTDADTIHAPDLIARSMNAMRRTHADLLSIAGRQVLGGFWEKLIQPQVFTILSMRYGGTESVNASPRVSDKIANGQCIFVRREAYDSIGGHASVRSTVAEDLMLAQRFFAARKNVVLMLGVDQLSTRMYSSLAEIIRGWRKNVFAGGLDSVPFGRVGRSLFPLLLLLPPLMGLLPPLTLLLALTFSTHTTLLLWALITSTAMLVWWMAVYLMIDTSPLYAFAYPLGASVLLYIIATAVMRGRRVTWKGRTYISR